MRIKVESDDGNKITDVHMDDIDLDGHSMNRVVLNERVNTAVNEVHAYEQSCAWTFVDVDPCA